ncbi:hypothetical protein CYCD_23360 [Tenuifilaceae bacterium CYCD]|nr:hypothetical protein CYCD_23360 [Tenuifilaceae bacterium CYCD]
MRVWIWLSFRIVDFDRDLTSVEDNRDLDTFIIKIREQLKNSIVTFNDKDRLLYSDLQAKFDTLISIKSPSF